MKPRLTVISSHVRRLPERSPAYVEKHAQREVDDHHTAMLCRALELAFAEDESFARRCMEGG